MPTKILCRKCNKPIAGGGYCEECYMSLFTVPLETIEKLAEEIVQYAIFLCGPEVGNKFPNLVQYVTVEDKLKFARDLIKKLV